ncbi:phage tail tape measure protein [Williamsia sp. 1135]|uniref:phage tail tape measure protein n=1 Tax=Williamsia sp. 1135 TaxID=1889262 RepID=UPI000A1012D7|nr:phage tail tape measure protein [Williamsia sp. 1135]ORM29196.1 phage tail tape measure protein [Williamsia sp. 1135]
MAIEIGTAYLSIVPETSQIPRGINAALGQASRGADRAGQDAGNRFANGLQGAVRKVGPSMLRLAGIGGLTAALGAVVSTGNTFTNSMNTMQAVSRASAAQMRDVSEAAKDLANDTSLPATSATDAASAMVELAKGGFTVEQSMKAARGTLQLAAAAQIDAASAATIQSQSLQAFGQNASFAGTAADILANAANASSAEITDVAAALQQSGTVANQFGLSMQDTAAAIAMMANAGIQGSDAGTLLKSALLALTDQGNPAQGAIEELGLTVYDAQGKFVGLSKLFGELETASKSMSAEQYQAATATLFGSDAMRIAGIAAQQGSEGYDAMVDAMGRQGSAAEVAAAKTQGLPGAWERFKNSMETASLGIYDVIDGPLIGAADGASGLVNKLMEMATTAGPKVGSFFAGIGSDIAGAYRTLAESGKIEEWGTRIAGIWAQLSEAGSNLGPIILQFSEVAAKAAGAMGFAAWESLLAVVEATTAILSVGIVPTLQLVADLANNNQGLVIGLVGAFLLFKMVPAVIGSVRSSFAPLTQQIQNANAATAGMRGSLTSMAGDFRNLRPQIGAYGAAMQSLTNNSQTFRNMQAAFINSSTAAGGFAGALRAGVAPAMAAMRTGATNLVNTLGGMSGVMIAAAAILAITMVSSYQKSKAASEGYNKSVQDLEASQTAFTQALMDSRGAVNDQVLDKAGANIDAYLATLDAAEQKRGSFMDTLTANPIDGGVFSKVFGGDVEKTKINETADAYGRMADAVRGLGYDNDQLEAKLTGGTATWADFSAKLRATGEDGKKAADGMQEFRDNFLSDQNMAKRLTPGFSELSAAMAEFRDETASAEDKASALKRALDALNPAATAQESIARHNEVIRQITASTKEAADETQGLGNELLKANGEINTTTGNGGELFDELMKLRDITAEVAANNGNMGEAWQKNEEAFALLAGKYKLTADQIRAAGETIGLDRTTVDMFVSLQGADEVTQQLGFVKEMFDSVPGQKTIEVQSDQVTEATREKLRQLGFEITTMPDGKTVKIEANDGASPALAAVINRLVAMGNTTGVANLDLNKTQFDLKDSAARAQLQGLDTTGVSPEVGLTIQKLLDGKSVSMSELQVLDQTTSNPKVDMAIDIILQKLGIVNGEIDKTAKPRQVILTPTYQTDPNLSYNTGTSIANTPGAAAEFHAMGDVVQGLPHNAQILRAQKTFVTAGERSTGGEAYIPLGLRNRDRSLDLWRHTGQLLGAQFQEFADGGIRVDDFDKLAEGGLGASRPLQGAPYDWAGVNWGDCSGAMSAFARLAAGLPIFGGRFSTATMAGDLDAMGAASGSGGPGDLRLGWYNGGEGGGHTAGTLPSGKPVEMGGPHGGGAYGQGEGVDNPNFTDFRHFKVGPSWTDPGAAPGGFVIRPDGTIGPAGNGDFSAGGGSGSGLSGSGEQSPEQKIATSISENLGTAASALVKGYTSDILGMFGLSDSPGWLGAASKLQEANQPRSGGTSQTTSTDPGTKLPKEGEDLGGTSAPQAAGPPALPAAAFTPTGDAIKDAVKRAFAPKGWADGPPWNATDFIVTKESGWNPLARNPQSGAFSLFQFLGSTKDQYLPDENPDPYIQGLAGARYIGDRYGDPEKAKAAWDIQGWYANGGTVGGRKGKDKNLIAATYGEKITNLESSLRAGGVLDAINSSPEIAGRIQNLFAGTPAPAPAMAGALAGGERIVTEQHNHYEQINHNPTYQSESEAHQRYIKFQRIQAMRHGG